MRHKLSRLRLRHKPAHSRSMQRNLVTAVLLYETVRTTKKRAEVIAPIVERLITVAKKKEPQVAIREINRIVTHVNASRKTMEVFKQRYANRQSGFTRMVPLGSRHGDGAKLVNLMLVDAPESIAIQTPIREKKQKIQKIQKKQKSSSKSSESSTSSESSKSSQ